MKALICGGTNAPTEMISMLLAMLILPIGLFSIHSLLLEWAITLTTSLKADSVEKGQPLSTTWVS